MKSARRRAREGVIQGLYEWIQGGHDVLAILDHVREQPHFKRADSAFFERLLRAIVADSQQLDALLTPYLDRPSSQLSPVEHAILWLGAHEIVAMPETPFRVIINEAVDLARQYGGTDGHRYVNGVLDKLVTEHRPQERRAVHGQSGT